MHLSMIHMCVYFKCKKCKKWRKMRFSSFYVISTKGKNAVQMAKNMRAVYGNSAIVESTSSELKVLIWKTKNIPAELQSLTMSKSKCWDRTSQWYSTYHLWAIKSIYTWIHELWWCLVRQNLTEKCLMDCICMYNSLLKCNKTGQFSKRRITGNEKWMVYNIVKQKRSWEKQNEQPHQKMAILCIW